MDKETRVEKARKSVLQTYAGSALQDAVFDIFDSALKVLPTNRLDPEVLAVNLCSLELALYKLPLQTADAVLTSFEQGLFRPFKLPIKKEGDELVVNCSRIDELVNALAATIQDSTVVLLALSHSRYCSDSEIIPFIKKLYTSSRECMDFSDAVFNNEVIDPRGFPIGGIGQLSKLCALINNQSILRLEEAVRGVDITDISERELAPAVYTKIFLNAFHTLAERNRYNSFQVQSIIGLAIHYTLGYGERPLPFNRMSLKTAESFLTKLAETEKTLGPSMCSAAIEFVRPAISNWDKPNYLKPIESLECDFLHRLETLKKLGPVAVEITKKITACFYGTAGSPSNLEDRKKAVGSLLKLENLLSGRDDVEGLSKVVTKVLTRAPEILPRAIKTLNAILENKENTTSAIEELAGLELPSNYIPFQISGKGNVSSVYLARNTALEEAEPVHVALKVVPLSVVSESPSSVKKYIGRLRELRPPFVAAYYDAFEHEGNLVITMEPFEKTLEQRMAQAAEKGKTLPLNEVLQYFEEMLIGLSFCHQKGIVHSDLCPSNIGISKDGHVRISDFNDGLYPHGRLKHGPVDYCSPKLLTQPAALITEEDTCWAAGVVLYEMLTGRKLFCSETMPDKRTAREAYKQALLENQKKVFEQELETYVNNLVFDPHFSPKDMTLTCAKFESNEMKELEKKNNKRGPGSSMVLWDRGHDFRRHILHVLEEAFCPNEEQRRHYRLRYQQRPLKRRTPEILSDFYKYLENYQIIPFHPYRNYSFFPIHRLLFELKYCNMIPDTDSK